VSSEDREARAARIESAIKRLVDRNAALKAQLADAMADEEAAILALRAAHLKRLSKLTVERANKAIAASRERVKKSRETLAAWLSSAKKF
jgi:hypothetical protein